MSRTPVGTESQTFTSSTAAGGDYMVGYDVSNGNAPFKITVTDLVDAASTQASQTVTALTATTATITTMAGTPAFSGLPLFKATNAITAFAGGGQGSATALTSTVNRITTCATAGDSVKLPTATAGSVVIVVNDGATAADIFPASGDGINALSANTAVRLSSGSNALYSCEVTGTWIESLHINPAQNGSYVTNTTTTTFAAGQLTGSRFVIYNNTQGTPGSIATRTATLMFADQPNARVGGTYLLRIKNGQGTGTLTVTAGTGVTLLSLIHI
jgi:hypothetical protein